jgi:predicted anti-sigma-YlaC factor YlaD
MRCDEAAEFVSRLYDGQLIPREVAEHIDTCEACRSRLNAYAAMGTELKRIASLEQPGTLQAEAPADRRKVRAHLWQKGWQAMRIPRLVFAALVVAIVVLGSSLVMVKARARTQGSVLLLTAKPTDEKPVRCAISLEDKKAEGCTILSAAYGYEFRVIAATEDRIELGVRLARAADFETTPGFGSSADIKKLIEKPYRFQPGEKLEIPVEGAGPIVVTGELIDHMPSWGADPNQLMDPKAGEIRFVSPALVRGNEVIADLGGASASTGEKNFGIRVYVPGEGLFHISLSQLQGAVEGRITGSRVTFDMDGQSYMFLLGAPVARAESVWILRDINYRPANLHSTRPFIGAGDETNFLANP